MLPLFCHDRESHCSLSPLDQDTDGLISQALLVGNFEGAVDLCLNDGRYPEAILLSISGGEELLKKTQQKYLLKQKNSISMVSGEWLVSERFFWYNHIIIESAPKSCSLYLQWWPRIGETLCKAVSWTIGRRLWLLCSPTLTRKTLPACAVSRFNTSLLPVIYRSFTDPPVLMKWLYRNNNYYF